MRFHYIEITKDEEGNETLLIGTKPTPENIAKCKDILGEDVEIVFLKTGL